MSRGQDEARVRGGARAAVLELLAAGPALTRGDLATRTGLPLTTVNSAVSRLIAEGVVRELPREGVPGRAAMGRPTTLLTLVTPPGPIGAVIVAHQSLHAAVVTPQGAVLARHAVAFHPRQADDVAGPGADLLEQALGTAGVARQELSGAVIGYPAPYLSGRGVATLSPASPGAGGATPPISRLPRWHHRDPAEDLARRLDVPVLADNDANLAALGETDFGAARGLSHVIYVKIIPGIGAGVLVNDQIVRGAAGYAGELAHLHVREDGPLCFCGGRGCLVTLTDSRALIELVRPAYEGDLTIDDIIAMSANAELGIHRILADLGRTLGGYLATISMFLNPQIIVVDGTLGPAAIPLIQGLRERIDRNIPPALARELQIVPGTLHDRAEIIGTAALARREGLFAGPRH